MSIGTLKEKVFEALKWNPETRNSDIELTKRIWLVHHSNLIGSDYKGQFVYLNDLISLPREDNIKRIRAKIQNEEGLFLPTSLEIARRRGINERVWREAMGYPVGNPDQSSLV